MAQIRLRLGLEFMINLAMLMVPVWEDSSAHPFFFGSGAAWFGIHWDPHSAAPMYAIWKSLYVPICTMDRKYTSMMSYYAKLYIMKRMDQMVLNGLNYMSAEIHLGKWCTIVCHFA